MDEIAINSFMHLYYRYVNRYLFISNRIIKQKYMPLIHNLINNVVHCGVTPKNKCLVSTGSQPDSVANGVETSNFQV